MTLCSYYINIIPTAITDKGEYMEKFSETHIPQKELTSVERLQKELHDIQKKDVQKVIADFADSLIKYEDGKPFVLEIKPDFLSLRTKEQIYLDICIERTRNEVLERIEGNDYDIWKEMPTDKAEKEKESMAQDIAEKIVLEDAMDDNISRTENLDNLIHDALYSLLERVGKEKESNDYER